jgi:hypothetical protein
MEESKIEEIFSSRKCGGRFFMLNEIYDLLEAKGLEPNSLFRSLLKAYSCELWFEFGDASLLLEREKTEDSDSQENAEIDACEDAIKISVVLERNHTSKSLTYEYRPSEFSNLFQTTYTRKANEETELVQKRKRRRLKINISRIDKGKIKASNRIMSYLGRKNRILSVYMVSKKLGISYHKIVAALLLLESLGLVEQLSEEHGKREYHFVKLTKKGFTLSSRLARNKRGKA